MDDRIYAFCCSRAAGLDDRSLRAWMSRPEEERERLARSYGMVPAISLDRFAPAAGP